MSDIRKTRYFDGYPIFFKEVRTWFSKEVNVVVGKGKNPKEGFPWLWVGIFGVGVIIVLLYYYYKKGGILIRKREIETV